MRAYQFLSLLLLCTAAASVDLPPPAPRRLLRCPADLAALVEPLPDEPERQPLLTAGPGVRLRTVRFLRDSALRLDSAGRLWLSRSVSNGSASAMRFSGPHVLLCSDSERRGLATFSLFVRLDPHRGVSGNASASAGATSDPAVSGRLADSTGAPAASGRLADSTGAFAATATSPDVPSAAASASRRPAASRFDDPLFSALAAAFSLLLLTCVALATALIVVIRRRTRSGLKGPIFRPPGVKGSAHPLVQQCQEV